MHARLAQAVVYAQCHQKSQGSYQHSRLPMKKAEIMDSLVR